MMTVLTMVVPATSAIALPFRVVTTGSGAMPGVDIVIAALDNMVPTIVEPVPMVAPAGAYQKTFLAWAPFMSRTWIGVAGVAGPVRPTVSVPVPAAIWNTQTAFASPPASSVRLPAGSPSAPMLKVPGVDL